MSEFNNFKNYNPDILETIANLSNDEVFTPPKLANEILDLLPKEIWSDSTITFLDPAVKTGIFFREIASRLIDGLAEEIPDLQERVNHIFMVESCEKISEEGPSSLLGPSSEQL